MVKKRGLGRGLDALIPAGAADAAAGWGTNEVPSSNGVRRVPMGLIDPNPHQPRARFDEADVEELADSIAEHGLIQPVIVAEAGDRYELIAGERRWRAAQLAGLKQIDVIVKEATPQQMLELALVENIQRADLNVLEEAAAFRQLMDDFDLTQEQVAERVGKSRSAVANIVRLLALPELVRVALMQAKISEGHGRALLRLPTDEAKIAALETVIKRQLTVRQTEELMDRLLGGKQRTTPKQAPEPEIVSLQEQLRRHLGTKVNVRHGKSGGRIVIHYYSNEELDAILSQIGYTDSFS